MHAANRKWQDSDERLRCGCCSPSFFQGDNKFLETKEHECHYMEGGGQEYIASCNKYVISGVVPHGKNSRQKALNNM